MQDVVDDVGVKLYTGQHAIERRCYDVAQAHAWSTNQYDLVFEDVRIGGSFHHVNHRYRGICTAFTAIVDQKPAELIGWDPITSKLDHLDVPIQSVVDDG